MNKFVIITDSTADLGKDLREKYDIIYLPMMISYNNKEYKASLDWDLYTPKELYDVMRKGTRIKTTQVPAETFIKEFTKYAENNNDILYIGCSSALSGSVNTANVIKNTITEEYTNTKIFCIDSLNSCLGEGMMVVEAAKMRNEGKTIEEIVDTIENTKLNYLQYATPETLEYLKRAGV